MLGEDVWIAVLLPGQYQGEGEAEKGTVSTQWTTVAVDVGELVWLREALQLNAIDDHEDKDDLDPLE